MGSEVRVETLWKVSDVYTTDWRVNGATFVTGPNDRGKVPQCSNTHREDVRPTYGIYVTYINDGVNRARRRTSVLSPKPSPSEYTNLLSVIDPRLTK